MSDYLYIYAIPYSSNLDAQRDLRNSGWEIADYVSEAYGIPYAGYTNYSKQIRYNRYNWSILFRQYYVIDSAFCIIKCIDPAYRGEDPLNHSEADKIFLNILLDSKMNVGKGFPEPILLKILKEEDDQLDKVENFCYLSFDELGKNKLLCKNKSEYCLQIGFDQPDFINKIKDDIITMLSLSEISFYYSNRFLMDEPPDFDREKVTKAFWAHKFLLLRGFAIQIFPCFFKNKISSIDNFLDYRYTNLIENQTQSIENQTQSIKNQNIILNRIHEVESGILYLTYFVLIDVVFTISSEFSVEFFQAVNIAIERWMSIVLSLVLAIISVLLFKNFITKSEINVECFQGYNDPMYERIVRSQQDQENQNIPIIAIIAFIAFIIIMAIYLH